MKQLGYNWTIFYEIWYLSFLNCLENSNFIKIWQEYRSHYMKAYVDLRIISHGLLPRICNVSDKSYRESQNTRWMVSNFLRKSCRLWDTVGIAVAQWLKCCATNRKVAGSIPDGVSGFFICIKYFRKSYGPGVDSASNRMSTRSISWG